MQHISLRKLVVPICRYEKRRRKIRETAASEFAAYAGHQTFTVYIQTAREPVSAGVTARKKDTCRAFTSDKIIMKSRCARSERCSVTGVTAQMQDTMSSRGSIPEEEEDDDGLTAQSPVREAPFPYVYISLAMVRACQRPISP